MTLFLLLMAFLAAVFFALADGDPRGSFWRWFFRVLLFIIILVLALRLSITFLRGLQ